MVLKQFYAESVTKLSKEKLLFGDLIIDKFEVVAKVQKPDGVRILDPIPLPFYDQERFPFLMSRGDENDFFVINTKDGTMQTLVKANHGYKQGFCIKVGEKAFDFHFCSMQEEDDKKEYEFHYVLSFKEDVITVMERTGQLPLTSLEEQTQLIEREKKASA